MDGNQFGRTGPNITNAVEEDFVNSILELPFLPKPFSPRFS
jgi:hypothetical protein